MTLPEAKQTAANLEETKTFNRVWVEEWGWDSGDFHVHAKIENDRSGNISLSTFKTLLTLTEAKKAAKEAKAKAKAKDARTFAGFRADRDNQH